MPRDQFFGTVEGALELTLALDDLAEEFGPRNAATAFNQPLKQAWAPVETYIRRETPVDTGNLKESTNLRVGVPTRSERQSRRHVSNTTGAVARAGWFWGGRYGQKTNSHQALAVEFGTQHQQAQRVLRRGFAQGRNGALRILGRLSGQAITRRARQLSRRRARNPGRFRVR